MTTNAENSTPQAPQQEPTPQTIPLKGIYPTIHINGTSRQTLINDYSKALSELYEAIRAFDAIQFNARDYYPQGPHAFPIARNERALAAKNLLAVRTYLSKHLEHICDSA